MQDIASSVNFPARQSVHAVTPAADIEPAAQAVQVLLEVAPEADDFFPAEQRVQSSSSSCNSATWPSVKYLPPAQFLQVVRPF